MEHELRPSAVEELRGALQLTRKALEQWRAGDEKYNHLSDDDIQRVQTSVDTAQKWLEDNAAALNPANKTQDPSVKVSAVREQKHVSASVSVKFHFCLRQLREWSRPYSSSIHLSPSCLF